MKRIIFLLVFITSGCATCPNPKLQEPIVTSKIFEASYDAVWDATLKAITGSGESITAVQKENGIISFQRPVGIVAVRKYAFTNALYGYPKTMANINMVLAKKDDTHTTVTINLKFIASGIYELHTTGTMEKEYFDKIGLFLSPTN